MSFRTEYSDTQTRLIKLYKFLELNLSLIKIELGQVWARVAREPLDSFASLDMNESLHQSFSF